MSEFEHRDGVNRRKVLECMTWCGTGVLVDAFRRRASLPRHYGRGAGGGNQWFYLPANQR
jgi:hypothetical protein